MIRIEVIPKVVDDHYNLVSPLIIKRAKNIIKEKKVVVNKITYNLDKSTENYLNDFILNKHYLKALIKGKPTTLQKIIKKMPSDAMDISSAFNRTLYNLFFISIYKTLLDKEKFVKDIAIRTCPYCNRNYIYSIQNTTTGNTVKPEIDHFYPKSEYPFLAVSFYNLIPVCDTCNGFSGKKEQSPSLDNLDPIGTLRIYNPYDFTNNLLKFSYYLPAKIQSIYDITENDIDIKLNSLIDVRFIKGYNELFSIEDFYKQHRDIAIDIIRKACYLYSPASLRFITRETGYQIPLSLLLRAFWGFSSNEKEYSKRPLNKFSAEILIQTLKYLKKKP